MKSIRVPFVLFVTLGAAPSFAQSYIAREVSAGGFANAIAGGIVGGSFGNHAYLWSEIGSTDLHPAGSTFSAIYGRSGNLSVGYAGTAALSNGPVMWLGATASSLPVAFAYVAGRAVATDGIQIVGYGTEGNPERGAGAQHVLLWDVQTSNVIDLGKNMLVSGVGGGQQAGARLGSNGSTAGYWRGAANTFTDLHPRGADVSVATGTDGSVQVGYYGVDVRVRVEAKPRDIRFYSAGTWTGTAASFTYLPSPYRHSFALGIQGDTIVGYGNTSDAIGFPKESHAVAWIGSERAYVDLHALLPAEMVTSRANAVDEQGNIVGYGVTNGGQVKSFIWVRQ